MRICLPILLAALLAGSAFTSCRRPQNQAPEDAWLKAEEAADARTKLKQKEVLAEVAKLGPHEWAGDYFTGDGEGMNLSLILAPTSGFVFEWQGCLGIYARDDGPAVWKNGQIHVPLTSENKKRFEIFHGMGTDLVLVAWGERRYLIPDTDIIGFCNDVNGGREPRKFQQGGNYLLRRGDEKKKVDGMPKVPAEYERYLLPEPVEATITAVGSPTIRPSGESKSKETVVTLDVGTKRSLLVGMELLVTKPEGSWQSVRITKAEDDQSEATMIQYDEKDPVPKVGWQLSTRTPWGAPKAD